MFFLKILYFGGPYLRMILKTNQQNFGIMLLLFTKLHQDGSKYLVQDSIASETEKNTSKIVENFQAYEMPT